MFGLINLVRPEADPFQNPHPTMYGTMQPQTDTLTRLLRCLFVRPLAPSLPLPCVAVGIAGIDYGRRRQ